MIKRTYLLLLSALLLAPLFVGIAGCNTIQGAGKAIKDRAMEVKKKL